MPKATRDDVYDAIDTERIYQDEGHGNAATDRPEKAVGEFILLMEEALAQGRAMHYRTPHEGADCVLDFVRKVAALAVRCMEQHGAPLR